MIPVCEPTLEKEELENIIDCVKSGWISSKGKYVTEFEENFSRYCGAKYGITTTNGTTALHLAMASIGIGKDDEVIMPTFTMVATAFAVIYMGAKPVFVDSEPKTWNMDVDLIEEKINEKTKAIMPVHIYGHPCDMDPILKIAKEHGISVIEDAAESHGAEYKGRKVGCLGDGGCFSFYANKIITCGEGGMFITNDEDLADRARMIKDLAHSKEKRFLHKILGYNFRMTNMQAAIGVAQFKKIERFVEMRRRNAKIYNSFLKDVKGITLPPEESWAKNVYWMYSILIEDDFGISRDELMAKLLKEGIDTRTFFIPMNQQPVLKDFISPEERFPIADSLSKNGMHLPSSSSLSEDQIKLICNTIRKISDEKN